jgi:hypothetical protein
MYYYNDTDKINPTVVGWLRENRPPSKLVDDGKTPINSEEAYTLALNFQWIVVAAKVSEEQGGREFEKGRKSALNPV